VAEFQVDCLSSGLSSLKHCCFSPDGRLIAAASSNVVYLWDITYSDPHPVRTFDDHTMNITSLTFSSPSSLISISEDKSVKFWEIDILSTHQEPTTPKTTLSIAASIECVALQIGDEIAISCDSAGVVKIWDIMTGFCKKSFQCPKHSSPRRRIGLIDGRLTNFYESGLDVCFEDMGSGAVVRVVPIENVAVDLKLSEDGSKLFAICSVSGPLRTPTTSRQYRHRQGLVDVHATLFSG
jgi:WD40 repeat protein